MKTVYVLLVALFLGGTLVSCTESSFAEDQKLFEQQANGDDGEENDNPDGNN